MPPGGPCGLLQRAGASIALPWMPEGHLEAVALLSSWRACLASVATSAKEGRPRPPQQKMPPGGPFGVPARDAARRAVRRTSKRCRSEGRAAYLGMVVFCLPGGRVVPDRRGRRCRPEGRSAYQERMPPALLVRRMAYFGKTPRALKFTVTLRPLMILMPWVTR